MTGFLTLEILSDVASMNDLSEISGTPLRTDTVHPRGAGSRRGRLSHDASCPVSLSWTRTPQRRDLLSLPFPAPEPASALLFRAAQKGSLARPQGAGRLRRTLAVRRREARD
jgi:hypothetical protein